VVLTRVGDKLFIDKRDGGPLDSLTVNETAPEQVGPRPWGLKGQSRPPAALLEAHITMACSSAARLVGVCEAT
jgi:hypothetical protein